MRALVSLSVAAALAACTGVEDAGTSGDDIRGLGGHPDPVDAWEVLAREHREGPPRYASRVHSCSKLRYHILGNVLASRGVDLARTAPTSAGELYRQGAAALGAADLPARRREILELGVATTTKLFDIHAQAAPEIALAIATRPACLGAPLFDAGGRCNRRGITCLIGVPATQAHLDLCEQTLARATDPAAGQALATAVLAAAAHTCE